MNGRADSGRSSLLQTLGKENIFEKNSIDFLFLSTTFVVGKSQKMTISPVPEGSGLICQSAGVCVESAHSESNHNYTNLHTKQMLRGGCQRAVLVISTEFLKQLFFCFVHHTKVNKIRSTLISWTVITYSAKYSLIDIFQ